MAASGNYWATKIALADTDGAKALYALVKAVRADVPVQCSILQIQADDANGSNVLLVGDSHITSSDYGASLSAHDQVPYRHAVASGFPWTELMVLNPTAASTVYFVVEIWR